MSYANPNLDIYIYRITKMVHPGTGLSGESIAELNNINKYLITKIMNTVNNFLKGKNKKTLDNRDVQASVSLVFPGELSKHAISDGLKAVTKFNSYKKDKKTPVSQMHMAGLTFPVARTEKIMRHLSIVDRMGKTAPVYMAAVLEYINAEILELAGNVTKDYKKVRITPRYITIAIMNDTELNDLFCDVTLGGGVLPSNLLKI